MKKNRPSDRFGQKYKIIRFRRNKRSRIVKRGLTLKEAQAHCSKSSTHGDGWFDGYTKE